MNTTANSAAFWLALISALAVLYFLPIIIGLARQAEPIAVIIVLTVFPLLWPAALIGAFMLPRKHYQPTRPRTWYANSPDGNP